MATTPEAVPPPPRFNPFVFPADTTFRFLLLIVSIVGASLFLYNSLTFFITYQRYLERKERCEPLLTRRKELFAAYAESGTVAEQVIVRQEAEAVEKALAACNAPYELATAGWQLGGLALLLAVATTIFWLVPRWIIRRAGLEPLPAEEHPELLAYLQTLCREAGLIRTPTFLWNPLRTASTGLAFGRFGRYYVMLSGGLVQQFTTDRAAFRAVVLHELAHLRNGDVGKTYFAVAIACAFVLAALGPFILFSLWQITIYKNWLVFLDILWRAVALGGLVYLMLAAVLRTREVYADARAALWEGPHGTLGRILGRDQRTEAQRSRWWAVVRFHPEAAERYEVMEEPERLLRMGFWEAFGTGAAAGIAITSVQILLQQLASGLQLPIYFSYWVPALIFALLVVGVAGTGMWRAAFAAHARGEAVRGAVRLGLGLGLGILLGHEISLESVGTEEQVTSGALWSLYLLLGLLLLLSLVLFLKWIGVSAAAWLQVTPLGILPRRVYTVNLLIAGVGLAVWTGVLLQQLILIPMVADGTMNRGFLDIFQSILLLPQSLVLLTLISLWAIPLAAHFMHRKRAPTTPATPLGAAAPAQPLLTHPRPFDSRLALWAGLAGGLIYCALLLIMHAWLRRTLPEVERNTDEFAVAFYVWQMAQVVSMQLLVAMIVAGWVRRLGALQGLCAAFVAACVMTVGFVGSIVVAGCVPAITFRATTSCPQGVEFSYVWMVFSYMVIIGGVLALPVALVVAALAGRLPVALRLGVLGGVAFCLLWFGWVVGAWLLEAGNPGDWLSGMGPVALAVLLQVGVATIAVVWVRRWGVLHALIAALMTACLAIDGVAVINLSFSAPLSPDVLTNVLSFATGVLGVGMGLALGAALIGALVVWARRRARGQDSEMRVEVETAR